MSRIHDALKRAERDSATRIVPEANPAASADSVVNSIAASAQVRDIMEIISDPAPVSVIQTSIDVDDVLALDTGSDLVPSVALSGDGKDWLKNVRAEKWAPDTKHMLFFGDQEEVVGVEEFRRLRSRMYRMRDQQKLKSVAISSAVPGEGKSFVAANLAQALAGDQDRNVLLIDGDLRKSDLNMQLGARRGPGVTDFLLGKAGAREVVQRGDMDGLFFISAGEEVANPAELAASGGVATLLKELAPAFDWIIVDTPPVVPIADAVMITSACDGILLVVSSGYTKCDVAQKAVHEFRNLPVIGVVLNRVPEGSTYSSKTRYGYGYYNHYGKSSAGLKKTANILTETNNGV